MKTKRVMIYSQDVGMEFGIEKCVILIRKSGKREKIELPNKESIRHMAYTDYMCQEKEKEDYLY